MSTLRSDMLRIASGLPQGDPTRRKLLGALGSTRDKVSKFKLDRKVEKTLDKYVQDWYRKQKDPTNTVPTSWASIPENIKKKLWKPGSGVDLFDLKEAVDDLMWGLSYKHQKRASSDKEAGSDAVLWQIIDQRGFYKLYNEMEDANDDSSASMLREISDKLAKSLELSGNEQQALSRLRRCVDAQGKWDPALQRNNIFKAANLLGIKLPHGMF